MSGFKYIESKKVSKAQKRRDAKAAKAAEQAARIEQCSMEDEHKDRRLEQEAMDAKLNKLGFKIHEVDADGDCLYKAVEHQLTIAHDSNESLSCKELRGLTSRYMLENADEFMPFLLGSDGMETQDDYKNYCNRIATTKDWGGHVELTAISHITKKPIHIYTAYEERPIEIGPMKTNCKSPIRLSFHKYLYHLGEHYNSLIKC